MSRTRASLARRASPGPTKANRAGGTRSHTRGPTGAAAASPSPPADRRGTARPARRPGRARREPRRRRAGAAPAGRTPGGAAPHPPPVARRVGRYGGQHRVGGPPGANGRRSKPRAPGCANGVIAAGRPRRWAASTAAAPAGRLRGRARHPPPRAAPEPGAPRCCIAATCRRPNRRGGSRPTSGTDSPARGRSRAGRRRESRSWRTSRRPSERGERRASPWNTSHRPGQAIVRSLDHRAHLVTLGPVTSARFAATRSAPPSGPVVRRYEARSDRAGCGGRA